MEKLPRGATSPILEVKENEEFISSLKSVVNENRLGIIPDEDLLEIYKRAKSIDASRNYMDIGFLITINSLLKEIKDYLKMKMFRLYRHWMEHRQSLLDGYGFRRYG